MKDEYITFANPGSGEITIQKSRFIGYGWPCVSEDAALDHIREMRELYRDARHHCYAYIIGTNAGVIRYSDDGEPGGTAGLPMLNLLRSEGLVNCCVVVIRYFGGILLGTGGLARAYSSACRIAMEKAGIVQMQKTCTFLCEVPYAAWDAVRYHLEKLPVICRNPEFQTAVSFMLSIRSKDCEFVFDRLNQVSNRTFEYLLAEEGFFPWKVSAETE